MKICYDDYDFFMVKKNDKIFIPYIGFLKYFQLLHFVPKVKSVISNDQILKLKCCEIGKSKRDFIEINLFISILCKLTSKFKFERIKEVIKNLISLYEAKMKKQNETFSFVTVSDNGMFNTTVALDKDNNLYVFANDILRFTNFSESYIRGSICLKNREEHLLVDFDNNLELLLPIDKLYGMKNKQIKEFIKEISTELLTNGYNLNNITHIDLFLTMKDQKNTLSDKYVNENQNKSIDYNYDKSMKDEVKMVDQKQELIDLILNTLNYPKGTIVGKNFSHRLDNGEIFNFYFE